MELRCLHIADIFAQPGMTAVRQVLPTLISDRQIDFVVANGENACEGKGITEAQCQELFDLGVHVITSGNHIWDRKKTFYADHPMIRSCLLRPANYPAGNPGRGAAIYKLKNGLKIGVLNLQGRTYMLDIDCPFRIGAAEVEELQKYTKLILIDFHAEATAEKIAFAYTMDGKVSAIIGTHTHVQTADERILSGGTAYITDVGMTGPHDGVIGMEREPTISKFVLQTYHKFEPAKGDVKFHGVLVTLDTDSGKALTIERLKIDL